MDGKFITFEGLDGCGKSTQLAKLALTLRERGLNVLTTREPGGTPVGEKIRSILLDSRTVELSPLTEMGLMFSSRAQQIDEVIQPALHAGTWVLCDRFTDSSEAYQGGGRQLGSAVVLAMHQIMCRGFQPDLTILMVSDIADSVARARRRNLRRSPAAVAPAAETSTEGIPAGTRSSDESSRDSADDSPGEDEQARGDGVTAAAASLPVAATDENRFERENKEFFKRTFDAYLALAQREPQRVVRIDALRSIPDVQKQIFAAVEERFGGELLDNFR